MAKANFDPANNRYIRGIIKRKVKQLIRRNDFASQDRHSLEQELLARVLQSLPRFNPCIGHLHRFVTAVVERHVANMIRNQNAAKRDQRRITSLNVMIKIADGGQTELAQTIADRELDARLGRERRSEQELHELALDLASVTATFPKEWRVLLELRATTNMSEAAQVMGVPRTTLNDWMRHIRKRCEKAELRDYLK
jgi:RNA polymerase sigma-70 factor, ECF subfamily